MQTLLRPPALLPPATQSPATATNTTVINLVSLPSSGQIVNLTNADNESDADAIVKPTGTFMTKLKIVLNRAKVQSAKQKHKSSEQELTSDNYSDLSEVPSGMYSDAEAPDTSKIPTTTALARSKAKIVGVLTLEAKDSAAVAKEKPVTAKKASGTRSSTCRVHR